VFVADSTSQGSVFEIPTGTGTPTVVATGYQSPAGVAVTRTGVLFVADEAAGTVYEQEPGSTKTVYASGLDQPQGLALTAKGVLYVADSGANEVLEYPAGGGTPTPVGTGLSDPTAVAVNSKGDLYVADTGNDRVVEVMPSGKQVTVDSGLAGPEGVAVDAYGTLYISDTHQTEVFEVAAGSTTPQLIANGLSSPEGLAAAGNGIVLAANTGATDVVELNAPLLTVGFDGGLPTVGSGFVHPVAVAVQPISLPGKPTIGVAPENDGAIVSFAPPASDGNSAISSYTVSFTDVTSGATTKAGSVGSSPVTITGLEDGQLYDFSVAAVNGLGTGPAATMSNVEIGTPATVAGLPGAGVVGSPYQFSFAVSGTPRPTISVSGTLPPGLSLSTVGSLGDPAGRLTGTPTAAGTYRFTIDAHNGIGSAAQLKVKITIAK
jgi:hypothetical protein